MTPRAGAETSRQARLRGVCPYGRGGAIPLPRTRMELIGFEPTAAWAVLCAAHNSISEKPLSSILVSLFYQARTYFQNR